jgi:hypothetical protein
MQQKTVSRIIRVDCILAVTRMLTGLWTGRSYKRGLSLSSFWEQADGV